MSWLKGHSNGRYASMRTLKPLARSSDDLVIEEVEGEVLVYDPKSKRAHCLGADAARVWRACDGTKDVAGLSEALELPIDVVSQALGELEGSALLEDNGLTVVNGGSSNGEGLTRRQFGRRTAAVGTAAIAAPMLYSIAVPSPAAAATPTPFQCQLYTTQDCGTSAGCAAIAGCCCCCQGGGSCKVCSATDYCNKGLQTCSDGSISSALCSSTGTNPIQASGCCGISGAKQCGCGWGTGGGCCYTHAGPTPGGPCTPGDANCVPCCNGKVLIQGSGTTINCCTNGTCNTCDPTTDPTCV